jgi:long-chain acyl-CoA synthetase
MLLLIAATILTGYIVRVLIKMGFHQRLPLAFRSISLEKIPDRAANKYGDRIIFTTDIQCLWKIPQLKEQYPDALQWSAKRIQATVGLIAKMLQEQFGVARGERVAILKKNHFDIHLFHTAIVRAGGIACPVNGKFAASNTAPYLFNIDAAVLITDLATLQRIHYENGAFGNIEKIILAEETPAEFLQNKFWKDFLLKHSSIKIVWLEEAIAKVDEEAIPASRGKNDPVYLVHSSGTTGFPKAVILRNGPQSHAVRGWLCYVHLSRHTDKGFLAVPNNHQAVILTFNSMLLMGLRAHWTCAYDQEGFNANTVIEKLSNGQFTGFFGFPITYTQLKEVPLEKYNLSGMRFWATTADASHEAIIRRFISTGNFFKSLWLPFSGSIFLDAQGSSEVGTPSVIRYISALTKKFERRIGKPGSTPFGPKIRIIKTNKELAKTGETGRLEVKGKTVFDAYWNNHSLTCHAFTGKWFFTGDVVRFEKDGNIIQLDREVDVIHTRCGDVYSLPIEEKIHKHSAVFDACVYGKMQEDKTQLPAIAVALRDGFVISENELLQQLNELLTKEEKLHHCEIMKWSDFPIGVTGKTLKRVFRERSEMCLQKERRKTLYPAEATMNNKNSE